jgi:hypothetical protein
MKIRFKARRISGNDPLTLRNPYGDPIMLVNIGDISQDIPAEFAHKLCGANSDILEIVSEPYQAKPVAAVENKMAQAAAQQVAKKRLTMDETALTPPLG